MKSTVSNSLRALALIAAALLIPAGAAMARGVESTSETATPTSVTPLTRDDLLAALTHHIAAHFNLEGDLQLEMLRTWTPPTKVATKWDVNILDFPSVPSSSMMVRCRVVADGNSVAEATFVLKAQLWRDAWVSRVPLNSGTMFDPVALETRRVDLLRDRDALPAAVGDRSYVFARAVPASRLLTWRDIMRRPLVKKGDVVEVSAVAGLLVVTMKALAMENGAQGETVTVRNPESQKNFSAMVVAENRVQIRF